MRTIKTYSKRVPFYNASIGTWILGRGVRSAEPQNSTVCCDLAPPRLCNNGSASQLNYDHLGLLWRRLELQRNNWKLIKLRFVRATVSVGTA